MKRLLIALLIISVIPLTAYADDTEIYGLTTTQIKPNVLIIFDNSGSMNDEVRSAIGYDPWVTYPVAAACGGGGNVDCQTTTVYRFRGVEQVWQNHTTMSSVQSHCTTAYNKLSTQGTYTGKISTAGYCKTTSATFANGNYINFLVSDTGETDPTTPKLIIAKNAIRDLVSSTDSVNFGLMIFNTSQGGYLLFPMSDMAAGTNRQDLINAIGDEDSGIVANTWTPLAETLYESMRYYSGQSSAFNGGKSYTSPIQYSCQKNYIILMTDGMSTEDRSPQIGR